MGLGFGVRVEEDDRVRALQVEPEAACARREHEDEVGRVGRVELRQQLAWLGLGLGLGFMFGFGFGSGVRVGVRVELRP